jgi:hypothetical protein
MVSEQDDPSDRRRGTRIPVNAEFASMPSATFISDLSEYGVFVHTPTPAPRGTRLKLRFTVLLDDPVIVEGEGKVVRQQYEPAPGMGIEFTELEPEMILRINDVISRQRPLELGPPLERDHFSDLTGDTDTDTLETAATLTRGGMEDPLETAQTIRRDAAAKGGLGAFRPPAMPGSDEHAKTGLYQPVGTEDPDAE